MVAPFAERCSRLPRPLWRGQEIGHSRLPNNLNQLAKAVHSGSLPVNAQTEADIGQACRDVWIIRKALLMALGVETDHEPPRIAEVFNSLRD